MASENQHRIVPNVRDRSIPSELLTLTPFRFSYSNID